MRMRTSLEMIITCYMRKMYGLFLQGLPDSIVLISNLAIRLGDDQVFIVSSGVSLFVLVISTS